VDQLFDMAIDFAGCDSTIIDLSVVQRGCTLAAPFSMQKSG
jgi:hypothetical protein